MSALTNTIEVTIRDRSAEAPWGSGMTRPCVRTVDIAADCPKCGSPRGERFWMNQCDDGAYYGVQGWNNPCGHVDYYANVVIEAAALASGVSA